MSARGRLARAAALAAAALLAATCTERPTAPTRDNPLDPGNPETSGDAFHLAARASRGVVALTWRDVSIAGGAGYSVYRSRAAESLAISPDTLAQGLRDTTFADTLPIHDATSHYVVTVRNARGEESLRSGAAVVRLDLPPLFLVRVPGCAACPSTERRLVEVVVAAEDADSVHLASARDSLDLVGAVSFPYTGTPIPWTLPASATDADTVKPVHGRVRRTDGSWSEILSDSIAVTPIALRLLADGLSTGPITTGRRSVALEFRRSAPDSQPPVGAESLEVTLDEPFPGSWVAFAGDVTIPLDRAALDTIHARVKNDFGLEARDSIAVQGDSLLVATIIVNNSRLPVDAPSTGLCRVNVHVRNGRATRICLSNAPIPPCPPSSFEDLVGFRAGWPLDGSPGAIVQVHAILANEWRPEGAEVLGAQILLRNDSLAVVKITSPRDGDDLRLGVDTTIVGFAKFRTCVPSILSVALFAGDAPIGEPVLETAEPADSVDLRWSLPWRVSGADFVNLVATASEADSVVARDTVQVIVVPSSAASRAGESRQR